MSNYEVVRVQSNTPEWLHARKSGIGASETAVILGFENNWATPWSIYRDKVTDELKDQDETNYQYWGHKNEGNIIEWMQEREGFTVCRPVGMFRSLKHPWINATLDAQIVETDEDGDDFLVPLEIKNVDAWMKSEWDAGPPDGYQVQLQQQILVTGAPWGYIAALFGGNDAKWWKIPADPGFHAYLIEKTGEFWREHVVAKVPPAPTMRDNMAAVYPGEKDAELEADDILAGAWIELGQWQAAVKEAEPHIKELTHEIQDAMRNHAVLKYEGETLVTWNPRKGQSRVDRKALKRDHPAIEAEYTVEGAPTRVFQRKTAAQIEQRKEEIIKLRQRQRGVKVR